MPSEQRPASPRTPRTDFNEGAQPEPPRSAVRALLGLPADKGGRRPSTAKMLLPAGLRYGQSPLPGWGKAEERGRDTGREGRDEQDSWDEGPIGEVDSPGSDALDQPVRSSSQEKTGPAGGLVVAQGTPAPISRPPSPTDAPTAGAGQPQALVERTSLAMPGVSTRRQDFPALSHPQNVAAASPAGADQAEALGSGRYGSPDSSAPPVPGATTLDAELLDRLERLVTDAEAGRKGEAQTIQASEQAAPRYVSYVSYVSSASGDEVRRGSSADASRSPAEQASVQSVDRANKDLAEQLEQLRRMVRGLTTQASSQPAQQPDQPQPRERPSSRPTQRVAIIKRSPPSRTPRAFWERSHLGRLFLRSLR